MTTYEQPPVNFDQLIAPFPDSVRDAAEVLRALIRDRTPTADENVSGGLKFAMALYSLGQATNVICGLQPTASHCKLYLHHVRPGDIAGLKLEGSGKNARHVKVASPADARRPEIAAAIDRAARGG